MAKSDETLNNLQNDIIETIRAAIKECNGADLDREEANDRKAAARSKVKAKGVNKASFDLARKVANMDPEQRELFYSSLQLCLEAAEVPITPLQMDLFQPKPDEPKAEE